MKVVILAGGSGTRFAEETQTKPKPMIDVGGRPIIWHIMKHYSYYGYNDFVIALGYLGNVIKEYFANFHYQYGNLRVELHTGEIIKHTLQQENWLVNLVNTGPDTLTAGRIKRLKNHLGNKPFMVTYGDGVSNINLHALLETHRRNKRIATVSIVRPPSRFGTVEVEDGIVKAFTEKSAIGDFWINGGFMVFEPEVFDYINGDDEDLSGVTLELLARENQLGAYEHGDFWQCMDNIRDKRYLESLWNTGNPPWRLWKE